MNLVIDTSFGGIWVLAPGCNPCHNPQKYFSVASSSTYVNIKQKGNFSYNNGYVAGDLGQDNIELDYGRAENLLATNQTFLIGSQDTGFEYMVSDGAIGFGSNSNYRTFLDNLKLEGKIATKTFSLYLNDNEYNNNIHPSPRSILIIGGIDTNFALSHESSSVNVNANTSKGYWEVSFNGIFIGDLEVTGLNSKFAIIDSGSGYISAPANDFEALKTWFFKNYDQCNSDAQQLIVCECSDDTTNYPDLIINLGNDNNFSLPSSSYFLQDDTNCLLLITISNNLDNSWVIGGPFLRKWYTFFDFDAEIVTFYPAKVSYDDSSDFDESVKWIIVFFVVLLIVIAIVLSVFLYLFCCRNRMNFEETSKPLFTAKYSLPAHYHRTAVRNAISGEVVPDVIPTSRQNRVFPGIAPK